MMKEIYICEIQRCCRKYTFVRNGDVERNTRIYFQKIATKHSDKYNLGRGIWFKVYKMGFEYEFPMSPCTPFISRFLLLIKYACGCQGCFVIDDVLPFVGVTETSFEMAVQIIQKCLWKVGRYYA